MYKWIYYLVGGAITILKNMKVNGKDDIPYMKWKIEFHGLKPPTSNWWQSRDTIRFIPAKIYQLLESHYSWSHSNQYSMDMCISSKLCHQYIYIYIYTYIYAAIIIICYCLCVYGPCIWTIYHHYKWWYRYCQSQSSNAIAPLWASPSFPLLRTWARVRVSVRTGDHQWRVQHIIPLSSQEMLLPMASC